MYNKIFTKILDSSIWLESDATRIVWMTFIAAMDETGFAQFACPANIANRARVSLEAAEAAIKILESPDLNSADPENEGRRIERVPGGWMILNAQKYREIVTRAVGQEKTRVRVARFRAKKAAVTSGNAQVTARNDSVTPSEADTESEKTLGKPKRSAVASPTSDSEWLADLGKNPAYNGLSVPTEFAKMRAWCSANNKQPTRRRFVNWLNRAERPLASNAAYRPAPVELVEPKGWRERLEAAYPGNQINIENRSYASVPEEIRRRIA